MTDYLNLIKVPEDISKLTPAEHDGLWPFELEDIASVRAWPPHETERARELLRTPRTVIEDEPLKRKANGRTSPAPAPDPIVSKPSVPPADAKRAGVTLRQVEERAASVVPKTNDHADDGRPSGEARPHGDARTEQKPRFKLIPLDEIIFNL
jgi:hypothetical protein